MTVDEVVTEGIMIQIPTKTRSQERTFVRLCEDLVNLFVEKPNASETQVCSVIKSALVSIVDRGGLIDENKMLGLTGELSLLNKMLEIARNTDGLKESNAINAWQSESGEELRDFGNNGIVIEVKTTREREVRAHTISEWTQIHKRGEERLFICSMSLREARTGNISMVELIRSIHKDLINSDGQAAENFLRKVEGQGVSRSDLSKYQLDKPYLKGFDTALFEVTDDLNILRSNSFSEGCGPRSIVPDSPVTSLSYVLELTENPILDSSTDFNDLLIEMMRE